MYLLYRIFKVYIIVIQHKYLYIFDKDSEYLKYNFIYCIYI